MSHSDLDLDRTMSNVELIRAILYVLIMFKLTDLLFFELWCTQTPRHTDRQAHTHGQA